jgi:hypothetical protein
MRDADINRKSLIQRIADFVQKISHSTSAPAIQISGTPKSKVQVYSPSPPYKNVSPSIRSLDTLTTSPSSSSPPSTTTTTPTLKSSSFATGEIEEVEDEGDVDVTEKDYNNSVLNISGATESIRYTVSI